MLIYPSSSPRATSDYKLGMELKSRGFKAAYLMSYLAEGEAPDEARNVFQQRSRWTKGHYQAGHVDRKLISRDRESQLTLFSTM